MDRLHAPGRVRTAAPLSMMQQLGRQCSCCSSTVITLSPILGRNESTLAC